MDDDYVWDQGAGLPVMLQDVRTPNTGSPSTTTYLYGLGLILETDGGGVTSYYMSDGLGSTSDVRDASGNAQNTYSYDVWGAIRTQTGTTANQFDFTGEQADHNANRGLVYLRARHYDPALGRFAAADSLIDSRASKRRVPGDFAPGTPASISGAPAPYGMEVRVMAV